jgi:hypothetical protein
MLKVALYKHDRNTKTKKGEHSNNATAGAIILIARYTQFPNLHVFIIYLVRSYILEFFFYIMDSPTLKNAVINFISKHFTSYTYEQKIEIKQLGRPTPELKGLITKAKKSKNEYIRHFNTDYYVKHKWLCGYDIKLAVYCFPYLCFGGDISWTKTSVTHLGHLSEKIKKHENSFKHLQNEANLKVLGTINIFDKTDSGYTIRIQRHNEGIDKNRYILEKILNCIKFCGQHNLTLRGPNEKINFNNKDVIIVVIESCKDLDVSLRSHFENSKCLKGHLKQYRMIF